MLTLIQEYGTEGSADDSGLKVKIVASGASRAQLLRQPDTAFGTVVSNTVLTAPGVPEKRHIGQFVSTQRSSSLF